MVRLPPGGAFELEQSDQGRTLTCGVGWHPRALPLRLMCVLFGNEGEKLAELGSNCAPFYRSGIRYCNAPTAVLQQPQAPGKATFVGADVVRLNFVPENFEENVGGICFALRTAVGHQKQLAGPGTEEFCAHARLSLIVAGSDKDSDAYGLCETNANTWPSENQSLLLSVISRGTDQIWRFHSVAMCVRTSLFDKGMHDVMEHLKLSGYKNSVVASAGDSSASVIASSGKAKKGVQMAADKTATQKKSFPPPAYKKKSVQHIQAQAPTHFVLQRDSLPFIEHINTSGGLELLIEDEDTDSDPFVSQASGNPKAGYNSTVPDAQFAHRLGEKRWKTSL